jgi:hypothetical protein
MVYVQPQFGKIGEMKWNTFKADHGAQVHECLRHAVIVDSQATHDVDKIMVRGIKFEQCFIVLWVDTLQWEGEISSKFHSWKYELPVLFMYPSITTKMHPWPVKGITAQRGL